MVGKGNLAVFESSNIFETKEVALAVALYRFKLGYELSSDDERTCQANGQWSGSAHTCDRKSE